MRSFIAFVLRGFIFWILFFLFYRSLLFGDIWFHKDSSFTVLNLFETWAHGLRLDTATASYILMIPVLCFGAGNLFAQNIFYTIYRVYSVLLIWIFSVLSIANIIIMRAWGTQLNYRALSFITTPREMFASLPALQILFYVFAIVVLCILLTAVHNKFVAPVFKTAIHNTTVHTILAAAFLVLFGILSRGGIQEIPINESASSFSQNHSLNQIASNNIWYLIQNCIRANDLKTNPYIFYPRAFADKKVEALYNIPDSVIRIFSEGRHNIVMLLLESHTADVIEELGGDKNVCPNISMLIKGGLLFSNIYSSGARTDEMLASVFSGFPAQPYLTLIRFSEKTQNVPYLLKSFCSAGYTTSFYYGGDLNFSNMKNYLLKCGFGRLTGIESFAGNSLNSKWGAHDEFVLAKQLQDLNAEKQPFFSALLTLSLHDPYESPVKSPFSTDTDAGLFKNVAWYTDRSIGNYFMKAKKQPWYNNTIFILMADHGNRLVKNRSFFDPAIRHIPLIIFGEPLKKEFRQTRINNTGSQHDIAATLLTQFNFDAGTFEWSNNLLNPNRHNFAYLCMDDAAGWVTDNCSFVFDMKQNKLQSIYPQNCNPDTTAAKSFLQKLYKQFLDL